MAGEFHPLFLFTFARMTVTTAQLLQGSYTIASESGLATNTGPNVNGWLLGKLAEEIAYCQSINNTVRAEWLLTRASSIYNPTFPQRF
jgi:hypothetical protein